MNRFASNSLSVIDCKIVENVPKNTLKSKKYIWKQFESFCTSRNYSLDANTSTEKLALILKDWGYNMRKLDGSDYKEGVIKTIWNTTATLLQEKFYNEFGRKFDPFKDVIFLSARKARDTKRKELQRLPEKQKVSSAAMTFEEHQAICKQWDENTPMGLQMKFYHIASVELAWRGGEASSCLIEYFHEEVNNEGSTTGRIKYNPMFSKTCQGGGQPCVNTKWLVTNLEHPELCPVRLFRKLLSKRGTNITTNRLFLAVNRHWKVGSSSNSWYKNSPVGTNTISTWTKTSAQKIGLDTHKNKISNHSNRATAVSQLIKSGIGEQEAMKITGHQSSSSMKPYLQINQEHHKKILHTIRNNTNPTASTSNSQSSQSIVYNNCIFNTYCSN